MRSATPQSSPQPKGEHKLKVRGGLGVEGELLRLVIPEAQILILDVKAQQPVVAEVAPVLEPLQIGAGLAEELQFHLLKFPDAEDEVTGVISLRKLFAHLAHTEGKLFPGGALDSGKFTKMP